MFYPIFLKITCATILANVLFANALETANQTNPDGVDSENRIYNGFDCSTDDYPFMVCIVEQSSYKLKGYERKCGGTLISDVIVLTAAHCIFPEMFVVAAMSTPHPQIVKVEDHYIHPGFNLKTLKNDIALLQLETSISKSVHVDYVKLPTKKVDGEIRNCPIGLVMGWGFVQEDFYTISKDCNAHTCL
ncbi:kallikrein-7-like [Cylas formicarius]|uniref:kallikrein-7-like n=1 Tax=Cylas formicarius TaxID=197179 RepID=UPI002958AD2C|nr:kallikrein-7-like [Cylas formicarius]